MFVDMVAVTISGACALIDGAARRVVDNYKQPAEIGGACHARSYKVQYTSSSSSHNLSQIIPIEH